jgi:hypothetical protein
MFPRVRVSHAFLDLAPIGLRRARIGRVGSELYRSRRAFWHGLRRVRVRRGSEQSSHGTLEPGEALEEALLQEREDPLPRVLDHLLDPGAVSATPEPRLVVADAYSGLDRPGGRPNLARDDGADAAGCDGALVHRLADPDAERSDPHRFDDSMPPMGSTLSAHVVLESGDGFTGRIANLTPSSVFIRTHRQVRFRERVTVSLFSVTVVGEVVHASTDPPGIVIAFDAPDPTLKMIEERMDKVSCIWPDPGRNFDRHPTLENVLPPSVAESAFDEPTNTGSPAPQIPEDMDTGDVLNGPAAMPLGSNSPRLRATTVVGENKTDEVVFDEPTEDSYPD